MPNRPVRRHAHCGRLPISDPENDRSQLGNYGQTRASLFQLATPAKGTVTRDPIWYTARHAFPLFSGLARCLAVLRYSCRVCLHNISIRQNTKERRLSNVLTITNHHRELWQNFSHRPELFRVLQPHASLKKIPMTIHERGFVNLIVLHLRPAPQVHNTKTLLLLKPLRRKLKNCGHIPCSSSIYMNDVRLGNALRWHLWRSQPARPMNHDKRFVVN
jgi:hypothetical protein